MHSFFEQSFEKNRDLPEANDAHVPHMVGEALASVSCISNRKGIKPYPSH